jgi:hypothetical protein
MQTTDISLALAYGLDLVLWARDVLDVDSNPRAPTRPRRFCTRPALVHGAEMPDEGAGHKPG